MEHNCGILEDLNSCGILALFEGLSQAKALCLSNLTIKGDSASAIYWVTNRKRGSWKMSNSKRGSQKFDKRMHKIIHIASELGCSLFWVPHSANQVTDQLAKQGAKHLASFVGDFLPPSVSNVSLPCICCFSPFEVVLVSVDPVTWVLSNQPCTSLKDCLSLYLSIDW